MLFLFAVLVFESFSAENVMKSDKRKTEEKIIIELRIDSFDFIDNPHNVPAINVAIIIDHAKKNRIK